MRSRPHPFIATAVRLGFALAMTAGTLFIAHACLAYLDEGDMHPFILEKLPLAREELFTLALYVHLAAALVSLPGCLALTSRGLLRRLPRLHRWLGRCVGVVVLAALVPSGSYLAFFARGGVASTVGFLLSGAIVAWAMLRGIATARRRDFAQHRRCTAHVVAQMSVAVTSRAMLVGLAATDLDPERGYIIALWVPVLLSAAIAERIFAPRTRPAPGSRRHHEDGHRLLRFDPAR